MLFRYCLPFGLTYAARSYTCVLPFTFRIRAAASHRGSDVARRVASPRVALRARVRFTYYHRRNARENNKYNYHKPAGAVRSRNALAKCTSHEAALGTVARTITLRVIIKGCGRKLHIYRDHYLSSMLQRCIENLLRV